MMSMASSHDRFATTRWSVVMQSASADSADASHALTELAQRYWYPVYAYVRRCGHAPAVAQDITRSFLGGLMRQFSDGQTRHPQGYFRRYLLDQLNAFLGGDWREVVDNGATSELTAPVDLEARNARDNTGVMSPEHAYQRSFALEVIVRAFRRLHSEARQTGHLAMYQALEPHLVHDPVAGEYNAIAEQLQMRPLALIVALKRLRQRFRELVAQELADTVTSAEELAIEQVALHEVLGEMQTRP
jgi:DNA-directed RNA polymerase specialized sigma24 family protein